MENDETVFGAGKPIRIRIDAAKAEMQAYIAAHEKTDDTAHLQYPRARSNRDTDSPPNEDNVAIQLQIPRTRKWQRDTDDWLHASLDGYPKEVCLIITFCRHQAMRSRRTIDYLTCKIQSILETELQEADKTYQIDQSERMVMKNEKELEAAKAAAIELQSITHLYRGPDFSLSSDLPSLPLLQSPTLASSTQESIRRSILRDEIRQVHSASANINTLISEYVERISNLHSLLVDCADDVLRKDLLAQREILQDTIDNLRAYLAAIEQTRATTRS